MDRCPILRTCKQGHVFVKTHVEELFMAFCQWWKFLKSNSQFLLAKLVTGAVGDEIPIFTPRRF